MKSLFFLTLLFFSFASYANKSREEIVDTLKGLYPELSSTEFQLKLDGATTPSKFYRTFVRYYYFQLKNSQYDFFRPYEIQIGPVAGDPHLENFGFIINSKGESIPGINDFDDFDIGPVVYDLFRFFVSAQLTLKSDLTQIEIETFLKSYSEGLKGTTHNWSDYWLELKEESQTKGKTLNSKYVDSLKRIFIKKKDRVLKLSSEEKTIFSKLLSLQNIVLLDIYKRAKPSGGSAGLPRYEVLSKNESGEIEWPYFKTLLPSAINSYKTSKTSYQTRLSVVQNYFKMNQDDLALTMIQGKPFMELHEWSGNVAVETMDLKKEELKTVINDEAYLLGKLHAFALKKSFKKSSDSLLLKISSSSWKDYIQTMSDHYLKVFEELNP
ncbi:MAG: DUF2252 family protein [Bacteriovoracaceae bacterium]